MTCYLNSVMAGRTPMSLDVEVFMTKEEALYAEWEHGDGVVQRELCLALF